jgi:hypothetical protein
MSSSAKVLSGERYHDVGVLVQESDESFEALDYVLAARESPLQATVVYNVII